MLQSGYDISYQLGDTGLSTYFNNTKVKTMKSQTPQFINSALAIFGEKLIQVNDSNDFFGGYLEYDEIRSPSNDPKVLLIMHLNEGKLALNLGDDGKLRTEWVYRNNGLSNNLNESMILENIDFLMALKLLFSDRVVGLAVDMIKEFEALLCVKHNQQMIDFSKATRN